MICDHLQALLTDSNGSFSLFLFLTNTVYVTHSYNIILCFLLTDYIRNCIIGKGGSYKGTVSITKSGIKCQPWNSMIPHEHR